jgi:hypothetical protein
MSNREIAPDSLPRTSRGGSIVNNWLVAGLRGSPGAIA